MGTCPSCAAEVPDGYAFCGRCGAAIDAAPEPSVHEERKVVTVLFCDLVGFTAASESADPEDVRARIRPYNERLRGDIEHFGGTVEKFIGDAVMAVFGAPTTHEDDAERAVRSGLRILDSLAELNTADPTLGLRVRIGINTGQALVTLSARPDLGEGFVTGDVVNTASRIQAAAPVDGVAVSEETYRQTERIFVYENLPAVEVKGKAQPLSLHRAVEARARFGADLIRTHESPFVGRAAERALLTSLFDRCARDSQTQLVTLVGEPGAGKSRLCAELFAHIDERPELITWRQGRCLPYGDGITFWALGEIIKAQAGIFESDSADAATEKLDAALPDLSERAFVRARLLPLIGIESPVATTREESFSAWRTFIEAVAATGPAVLVFEDLHWADPALLDFLTYLAEWAEGVPLLLVCTARPELLESNTAWASGIRNATTINLAPLTAAETDELVGALVARAAATAEIRQQIVERSGGNPLYAEEFVRLLAEQREVRDGNDFPDNVHALIAARLDTLPPARKALLQDAAVMGKVFWAGALAALSGRDLAQVQQDLHELSRKELIRPSRTSSIEGESEFAFWHALIRDVAYGQIPRADRSRRHQAAAAWIEDRAGARAEDLADVLAHHFLTALDAHRDDETTAARLRMAARRYLALAAARAEGLDAALAAAKIQTALALEPIEPGERAALQVRWSKLTFHSGSYQEARAALDDAIVVLRSADDPMTLADALVQRASFSHFLGDAEATPHMQEAVAILEERPGPELVEALTELARYHWLMGESAEAASAADRILRITSEHRLPLPPRAAGYRGVARAERGEADGLREAEEAIDRLVAAGAGIDAVYMMSNVALMRWLQDGPVGTIASVGRALEFARLRHIDSAIRLIETNALEILADAGHIDDALARAHAAVTAADESGLHWDLADGLCWLAYLSFERGDVASALDQANRADELARTIDAADMKVALAKIVAVFLGAGHPERSVELIGSILDDEGVAQSLFFPVWAPVMVRTALAAGQTDLAHRVGAATTPTHPLHHAAANTVRAALAEANGDHRGAVAAYDEATAGYRALGSARELAWSLLGAGRSRAQSTMNDGSVELTEARELFVRFGFHARAAEADAALQLIARPAG